MSKKYTNNHPLIKLWKKNQSTINGWLTIPDGFSAEIMAHQGFHSITIDMQHGVIDYQKTVEMIRAINTTSTPTIVRVPWLDPASIMKTLDAGATGIICPMINNKEQAQKLVEYASYAPMGTRSFGPTRAPFLYGDNYQPIANSSLLVIAMIETKEALENLDDIIGTEGIDAIFIGPSDLSLSLGYPAQFNNEDPYIMETIEHIVKTTKKHGKYIGLYNTDLDYALKMVKLGFDYVTVSNDSSYIAQTAYEITSKFKNKISGIKDSKKKSKDSSY